VHPASETNPGYQAFQGESAEGGSSKVNIGVSLNSIDREPLKTWAAPKGEGGGSGCPLESDAVPAEHPKLAICNFIPNVEDLKQKALAQGFAGVDWSFHLNDLPSSSRDEVRLLRRISWLRPLEVRYHCAFNELDLGDTDPAKADAAMAIFRKVCLLISQVDGHFLTIHVGLGRESTLDLSWRRTLQALADLVRLAEDQGICVCLENLATGWSSRPDLFEKLIRKSGAGVTLDIGHAMASPSVESQHYGFEDFITPHQAKVRNAHIYHEEHDHSHWPPQSLDDIACRLDVLRSLPCDWWVLELRDEPALLATLGVIGEYFSS
jgi:sugar phosphate isomerase/epimerase